MKDLLPLLNDSAGNCSGDTAGSGRSPESCVRQQHYQRPPGAVGHIEFALYFAAWMQTRRHPPTYRELMDRFQMTRCTAYRFLRRWKDVVRAEQVAATGRPA